MAGLVDVAHQHVAIGIRRLEHDRRTVAAGKIAAADRAIGIGHDQEFLLRIDRLALETEIDDAMRIRRDDLAVVVVASGLSDVDRIGHAVDDVEIIGGEGAVEQRLALARVRIDAAIEARRALQPFAQ